jgi:hypothetical protein
MTDWWSELEHELLTCVEEIGLATPAEVGRRLGFSETSAASLLAILVREGKVRMCLVQSAAQGRSRARPAPTSPPLTTPRDGHRPNDGCARGDAADTAITPAWAGHLM